MAARIGQQLGNYRLVLLLGQGGFAQVYLGEHVYLQSPAALKVLHRVLTDEDADDFLKEARTLVRLSHPHIVRVLDFAIAEGTPFLVMEYAPHGTLRQRHPKGTHLLPETIVPYVQQVASALQYAHDQQLIHRDVKPENMLLGAREEVLLSDFGLAILTPHSLSSAGTEPMERSLAGTTPYLAPEQLRGKARPASDQYALGVVVYEWLCGTPPFRGPFLEIAVQHVSVPPPSMREHVPDLTTAIEEVVLRALAKEPEARWASVQEFADALARACQAPPLHLASPGSTVLEPAPASTSQVLQSARKPEALWKVPTVFAPLIGREQEVAAIVALLLRPEVRLVTLLGTGGIGKTSLALQVAAEMRDHFADGVCAVPLAPITDSYLVVSTIAEVLEIPEIGKEGRFEQVKLALRERHLLLVLDNFEQILTAAPHVEELLLACPNLKVVVTSRAVLYVQGEQEFPVSPLALPDLRHLPESEKLVQYAAVALFVRRARAVLPTFQVTQANARAIAEICVRLDGLPLAIELAAARIKLLPPQALLARLSQSLQVLTGGARTLPERQRTLRNTLKWSYDLLDAGEQLLFRRLAVFVDGWTLEAVEAVVKVGNETASGAFSLLDRVASLLDKSLLLQIEQEVEEPRLQMLMTVREYGLECLRESGETEETQRTHALYYLALAEKAEPHLKGAEQLAWLARLEREQENLRAALHFLLEQAGLRAGETQTEQALRLCVALSPFWYDRGYGREGLSFLMQALAFRAGVGTALRARALDAAASLAFGYALNMPLEQLAEESLALYQELGDAVGIARSLHRLGIIARARSQFVLAQARLEEAAARFQELGDRWRQGQCTTERARIAMEQGQYEQAHALLEQSLLLYQELGDQQRLGWVRFLLAYLLFVSQQDQPLAQHLAEQSLAHFREQDNILYSAAPLSLLGLLHLEQGQLEEARALLEESLAIDKQFGTEAEDIHIALGRLLALQGDAAAARRQYQESLTLLFEGNVSKENIAASLEGLAALEVGQGAPSLAARLWGAAEALREAIGAPMYPVYRASYEQAMALARATLGEEEFAAAWAQGRAMTPEEALAAPEHVTTSEAIPAVPQPATVKQPSAPTYPDELTAREVEILRLVAQGWTDGQIAEQLVISPRTVNAHLTSMYRKIGVSSRNAATRYALEHQLV